MSSINRLFKNIYKNIRQLNNRLYIFAQKRRLISKVEASSKEYQDYLDIQLNRTISKRKHLLPNRARKLIDKTSEIINLGQCEILCIGCRNTSEIEYFRQKGAKTAIGIDLFSEHPDILIMDMHKMTFEDNSFDLVYSSHSLEHSYDHKKVAKEIIRVLRSGTFM